MKTLIIGGVKSGKSREAERIATDSGDKITLIATALPGDEEMRQRIARHQQQRPAHWLVQEVPYALSTTLDELSSPPGKALKDHTVVVDCLTLWLTQLLCSADNPQLIPDTINKLVDSIIRFNGTLIMVSNESGLGVTPADSLSRRYLDHAGVLHQRIAAVSDNVTYMVAGLPMTLKQSITDRK